jgi:hypothetical protein
VGARETTYEYDADGRVSVSRTWVESEWDADQAAMMMALHQYEKLQCSGCGLDVRETLDPKNEHAYSADEPWVCAGCMAIHLGSKKFAANGDEITPAHRFVPERG